MRRLVPYVCGAAAAASVMVASAEARADIIPISVGARVGYSQATDDSEVGLLPLQLDAMYNLGYGLRIGAYGSYAPAIRKPDPVDSVTLTRVGIQAHFKLSLPIIHPWVGVGTGYQHVSTKIGPIEGSGGGWEHFNLQGGVQFALLPILELGPYVQLERGKIEDGDAFSRWNAGLRAEVSF